MGRIGAWFGNLTPGMQALVVVAGLVLFVVLSPIVVVLATLSFSVCVLIVAYRLLGTSLGGRNQPEPEGRFSNEEPDR